MIPCARIIAVLTLLFAVLSPVACKQRVTQQVPVNGATGRMLDTARGVVRRVGNDPLSVLVLTSGTGANTRVWALAGPSLPQLERAAGLEISVAGELTTERNMLASPRGAPVFQVRHFFVRAADGQPAVDGVLNSQNGTFFLIAANGVRHDVPNLPAALRAQIGARIFLVGPLDRAPSGFGVLSER
ncbi:MAG: hypothetical protein ABI120_22840 [Gemmatimonadaceae bacterium]